MMKRYVKMPLKYALPLLFIGALVLSSTTGCTAPISVTPSHETPNAPTGSGTDFDVSISARLITTPVKYGIIGDTASASNKLVAIECSLKDNNVPNLFTVWREWKAIDATGTQYTYKWQAQGDGGVWYPKTTLQPNETAKGLVAFEIPNNATITQMRYTDETTGTHTLTCNVTS
jgi:hypothetical protein